MLLKYNKEIVCLVLLFLLALGVRFLYQKESVVNMPMRADAGRYFRCAYNLHKFGIYSKDWWTRNGKPPATRTDLSPGYPLFLFLHLRVKDTAQTFINRVLTTQAILGAATACLTFLIASLCVKFPWAIAAGLLTALSPHLIALDGFMLTESLFTFCLVLGVLTFILAWRKNSGFLTLLASVLLAFSGHVRAINLFLLPFLTAVFFFNAQKHLFVQRSVCIKHILFVALGFALIFCSSKIFFQKYASEGTVELDKTYVSTQEVWITALLGSYPGHFDNKGNFLSKSDPEYVRMSEDKEYFLKVLKGRFLKDPISYIKWYLGGKLLFLWNWNHIYNPGVYVYPMHRRGFEENIFLYIIHKVMYILHWPLFFLALLSPIILIILWRCTQFPPEARVIAVIIYVFGYFAVIFSILQAIPRYGVPLRPFVYIMSAAFLSSAVKLANQKLTNRKTSKECLSWRSFVRKVQDSWIRSS